jgi:chromosomal replication initiation ATPase DnaA
MLAEAKTRKEIRDALWNPANGRQSSELEIVPEYQLRQRRIQQIKLVAETFRATQEKRKWDGILGRMKEMAAERAVDLERKAKEEAARGILSATTILKVVASWCNTTVIDLTSERRTLDVVYPRQVAMYLCKHHTRLSYPKIGRKFGGKDHTTVLHAVKKIQRMLDSGDVEIAVDIVRLRRILGVEGK